jgi:hypothetical protein
VLIPIQNSAYEGAEITLILARLFSGIPPADWNRHIFGQEGILLGKELPEMAEIAFDVCE